MNKYNNGIIYKLVCKDSTITDIYIGSTTNFTKRKCNHKADCNNDNHNAYNHYKYEFIRAHGGWNNWDMIEIIKVNCNDRYELEKEERTQFDIYKPTLNKQRPQITNIEWNKQRLESCKAYREANKDKLKTYREANKDKAKAYREANKDKLKAQKKVYREANKDMAKAYAKAYYEKKKAEKLAALETSN